MTALCSLVKPNYCSSVQFVVMHGNRHAQIGTVRMLEEVVGAFDMVNIKPARWRALRTLTGRSAGRCWLNLAAVRGGAFPFQDGPDCVGGPGFIARGVAGIDSEQGGEVGEDLRLELAPVHRAAILGGSGGGQQQPTDEQPHRGMLPCFLRGMVSTLFSSMRRAPMTRGRVSRGSIQSST